MERKYLEWQVKEGGRRSLDEFARYLDVSRAMISMTIQSKRLPSPEMAYKWSEKLGDETILDIMGLARTDPQMKRLINLYDTIPNENKEHAILEFQKLLASNGWLKKS